MLTKTIYSFTWLFAGLILLAAPALAGGQDESSSSSGSSGPSNRPSRPRIRVEPVPLDQVVTHQLNDTVRIQYLPGNSNGSPQGFVVQQYNQTGFLYIGQDDDRNPQPTLQDALLSHAGRIDFRAKLLSDVTRERMLDLIDAQPETFANEPIHSKTPRAERAWSEIAKGAKASSVTGLTPLDLNELEQKMKNSPDLQRVTIQKEQATGEYTVRAGERLLGRGVDFKDAMGQAFKLGSFLERHRIHSLRHVNPAKASTNLEVLAAVDRNPNLCMLSMVQGMISKGGFGVRNLPQLLCEARLLEGFRYYRRISDVTNKPQGEVSSGSANAASTTARPAADSAR